MSRTATHKGIYFSLIVGGIVLGAWLGAQPEYGLRGPNTFLICVVIAVALLLPGRVVGFFWRDLLAGLRLLNKKEYAASKQHSERFLTKIREKPGLKKLIWLTTSAYSRDPEAMALNNLGAAEIGLKEFDLALEHLETAIMLDPKFPLPHYNIGILSAQTGAIADAEQWLSKAKALGYTGGIADKIMRAPQLRFAIVDGKIDPELKPPPSHSLAATQIVNTGHIVQLVNDDKTPMEFVVWVLENVFEKTHSEAVAIMLAVHEQGAGACGVYDLSEAEAKVSRMTAVARKLNFPLTCRILPRVEADAD